MFDAAPVSNHALTQDIAFAQALRLCGQTPVRLPSGQLMLHRKVLGMSVAMLPRAAPPSDLAAQLCKIGLNRTPVILSPETPGLTLTAMPLRPAQKRFILPLQKDSVAARAKLHPKWRNQLTLSEKVVCV
jgi:hypothetical protein